MLDTKDCQDQFDLCHNTATVLSKKKVLLANHFSPQMKNLCTNVSGIFTDYDSNILFLFFYF